MIADRCEINRQIRADNQMLRELKTQVSKLAQAVKHSIPVIAETMETIRNHMIFTQYHLLHNEKSSPDSCVKCYTMFLPFLLIKIDVFS